MVAVLCRRLPLVFFGGLLFLVTLTLNAFLAWDFDLRAAPQPQPNRTWLIDRAQGIGRGKVNATAGGSKRIKYVIARGHYDISYGFRTYDGKRHRLRVLFDEKAVNNSTREFGLPKGKLNSINRWYERAQDQVINSGAYNVDAQLDKITRQYRRRRKEAYRKAFFRFVDAETVEVDIPRLVHHNMKRLTPVARKMHRIVSRNGYGTEELVSVGLSMVQTAMAYEIPESKFGGRTLSGMLPPPQAFALGRGDCDTKSALLSSILLNWPRLKVVGISIPGHYLAAVHWIPRRGDIFIEYKGLKYVLLEPSGPAWIPPGEVSDLTDDFMQTGQAFQIDPIQI